MRNSWTRLDSTHVIMYHDELLARRHENVRSIGHHGMHGSPIFLCLPRQRLLASDVDSWIVHSIIQHTHECNIGPDPAEIKSSCYQN